MARPRPCGDRRVTRAVIMNKVNSSCSLASSWQKTVKAGVSFHSLTGASCKCTPRSRRAVWYVCCCSAIPSVLTAKRKCPHYGECDIDAARAGKTSGTQQLTRRVYDNRAGSDIDGSERTPHQAHTSGLQRGWSSRTSSRQSRSQTCQRYTERIGERSSTSGAQPIRRSQPYAPERASQGAGGHRHRS